MPVTLLRCGAPPESVEALPPETLRCVATPPDGEAIARLVIDALGEPIGLPALPLCVTPDDYVAIAVGHDVPESAALVIGVIAALTAAGIDRPRVRVVAAHPRDEATLSEGLAQETSSGVRLEVHDPAGGDDLCFAGLAKGDRPLMVNRSIFEADVVVPLSAEATAGDLTATDDAGGAYDGLFPDFFDQETIDRVRKVRTVQDASLGSETRRTTRRAESDQAGWLVGAPLVLRAVPGPGGGVAAVLAGDPEQVAERAAAASSEAWRTPLIETADVVLAIVSGGPGQQTWTAVGRALAAAERLAGPGAVLAVWSDLEEPIGEKLMRLADVEDRDRVASELAAESGDEALAAWRVLQAIDRGPVFLRSKLDADAVETLGLAPVGNAEEMQRLVGRFPNSTVLEEAQHVNFATAVEAP
ncbi:hypothetical protein MalM25_18460 [Planctomycetes bacterium MalM25]|nr:hypothetical protein MalM25_18460 [Planctomycetes bacterium MalM25]